MVYISPEKTNHVFDMPAEKKCLVVFNIKSVKISMHELSFRNREEVRVFYFNKLSCKWSNKV